MKAVIFDFDGVIHDTLDVCHALYKKAYGVNLSKEAFKDFFNGNVFESWKISESAEDDEKFFKMQKEAFQLLKIDENIKQSLKKLSRNHNLFIVSSNQEYNLKTYFHNNGFLHIFKEVLGEQTHQSKVEKFKHIFQKHNLEVEECIFVTDTLAIF